MKKTYRSLLALVFAMLLSASLAAETKLDINRANASEISQMMVGVGPAKAQAIIDYRELKGGFVSVDELVQVQGIGPATLEKNRAILWVEPLVNTQ